jgi:hypothetical protein
MVLPTHHATKPTLAKNLYVPEDTHRQQPRGNQEGARNGRHEVHQELG